MSKKQGIAITLISMMSLCLSAASLFTVMKLPVREAREIQYVMYHGTNETDTNEAVFSPNDAKFHADGVLTKHFGGFTIQEATGGWVADNGTVAHEYTLVIFLSDTTPDKVRAAADELLREFNQNSVLIQANEPRTEFYSGRTELKKRIMTERKVRHG